MLDKFIGKTFSEVKNIDDEEIHFIIEGDEGFKMLHFQDCCECVQVEDICGDLNDLVGSPILIAEEINGEIPVDDNGEQHYYDELTEYTFYKIDTNKGGVTIRWCGSSNGYYSVDVDVVDLTSDRW